MLYELLNNERILFFNSLSHIYLSIHELVTITNLLLISTLNYRLLPDDLPPGQLCSLQHHISKSLAWKSKLSLATSPKDKQSSFVRGGLGLWDLPRFVHKSVVNGAIRHLMLDSPPSVHQAVLSAYFQFNPNPLQDRLVDAAHALHLDIHGFGVWNPPLTQYLPIDSNLFVELSDEWVTATGDAEFWALLSCLRFIRLHSSAKHICNLSDNSELVSVFGRVVVFGANDGIFLGMNLWSI